MRANITTYTGPEYLAIDIANNYGKDASGKTLDKQTYPYRLDWFNKNEHQLEALLPKAETPALFYAGVLAYRQYQRGEAVGYPVSYDATNSGMQLLACMTGDRKAAEICNVITVFADGVAQRKDAYKEVHEAMIEMLTDALVDITRVSRDDAKRAVMTSLYGSEAVPKEVFGEGIVLEIFFKAMKLLAPAAWDLNTYFLDVWNPQALVNEWTLPDGMEVSIKVITTKTEAVIFDGAPAEIAYKVNAPKEKGRSLGANNIHGYDGLGVREITARCMHDPKKVRAARQSINWAEGRSQVGWEPECYADHQVVRLTKLAKESGFVSARILDFINDHNAVMVDREAVLELIDSLPAKPFQVISVHDCFRCLPHYVNDLRAQYNIFLASIAKSNILSFMLNQLIDGPYHQFTQVDPEMWRDVLNAEYSLS